MLSVITFGKRALPSLWWQRLVSGGPGPCFTQSFAGFVFRGQLLLSLSALQTDYLHGSALRSLGPVVRPAHAVCLNPVNLGSYEAREPSNPKPFNHFGFNVQFPINATKMLNNSFFVVKSIMHFLEKATTLFVICPGISISVFPQCEVCMDVQ